MNRNPLHFGPEELDFQISLLRLVTTAHQEWAGRDEAPDRQLERLYEATQDQSRAA